MFFAINKLNRPAKWPIALRPNRHYLSLKTRGGCADNNDDVKYLSHAIIINFRRHF